MPDRLHLVAKDLAELRERNDAVSEGRKEELPATRRVNDALAVLHGLVTDHTPAAQLESELRIAHGVVGALIPLEKAMRVIDSLPETRRLVATDVEVAYEKDPSATSYGQVIAACPSVLAVATYRTAHVFYQLGERLVARIMSANAHARTGIDIHPGAKIGSHFFIDHGTGVVIGETCVVGDRVKLYHGVTLGAFSNRAGQRDAGKKRHPTIGDDVTIYPNTTILGGDTVIGEGSVIGGNVWLTESVPRYTGITVEPPTLRLHQKPIPELGDGI